MTGTALLLLRAGIIVDGEQKRIKKYYSLFDIKFGTWSSYAHFERAELIRTNESTTMNSRATSTTVKTKTYDVVFVTEAGDERELQDFTDYGKAKDALSILSEELQIPSFDRIEEMRAAAYKRRKEREDKKR